MESEESHEVWDRILNLESAESTAFRGCGDRVLGGGKSLEIEGDVNSHSACHYSLPMWLIHF